MITNKIIYDLCMSANINYNKKKQQNGNDEYTFANKLKNTKIFYIYLW